MFTGITERLRALEDSNRRLESKIEHLITLTEKFFKMTSQQVQDLQAAVANDTTVEQSAITLLQGLSAQLKAAIVASATAGDLTAVEAVAQQIDANSTSLAAAVAANTPAAPANS